MNVTDDFRRAADLETQYVTWAGCTVSGPQHEWVEGLVAEIVEHWDELDTLGGPRGEYWRRCRRDRLAEIVRRHAGLPADGAAR